MVSSSRSGASIRSSSDKSHYSADSFPQPAGQLVTPKTDNANANSNRPRVSFEDPTCKMNEAYLAAGLAEIQKNASNLNRAKSVDSSQGLRRPTATVRNHEDVENSRRNRSFFSDVFAYREPQTSARDRISRESVIIVELKTNVDVRLSQALSPKTGLTQLRRSKTRNPLPRVSLTIFPSATNGPQPPSSLL